MESLNNFIQGVIFFAIYLMINFIVQSTVKPHGMHRFRRFSKLLVKIRRMCVLFPAFWFWFFKQLFFITIFLFQESFNTIFKKKSCGFIIQGKTEHLKQEADDTNDRDTLTEEEQQKVNVLHKLLSEYFMAPNCRSNFVDWILSKKVDGQTPGQLKIKDNVFAYIWPLLIDGKGDVNYTGTVGQTLIHSLISNHVQSAPCSRKHAFKDSKIIEELVKMGASVIIISLNGSNTALAKAILKRRIDLVHLMTKNEQFVSEQNYLGHTILHIMIDSYGKSNDVNFECYFEYIRMMRDLIEKGADVNIRDYKGMTPLHYAAKYCYLEMLQLFAQVDANFNAINDLGHHVLLTLLFYNESKVGYTYHLLESIKLLLRKGCNVNLRSRKGYTCLHYAARGKELRVVQLLVKAGADVNVKAEDGSTPLSWATARDFAPIIKFLRACGGKM